MLYFLALLSIFTSSIIAVYNWKVHKGALFIAGILSILSAYALTHYYSSPSESDYAYALLYGTLSPLWLLPGPLLFFYFRSIFPPEKIWVSWKDALHFVPAIVHLINILPYLFSPFEYKLSVAHAIHQDIYNLQLININSFYSFKVAFIIRPVVLLFYLFWCAILFMRQKDSINHRTQLWLKFFTSSLLITTLVYLYVAFKLFSHTLDANSIETFPIYVGSGIAYILLPITLILFFPEVLYGITKMPKTPETTEIKMVSPEDAVYVEELAKKIQHYLLSEKPYLKADFNLSEAASVLETPANDISYACKSILGKKFTEIKSHLRVEHAKDLLRKGVTETLTIDAIGTNSGFKSRSAFYDAFKAETGMTPSQYLENLA
jgi:AraC-like DNA-binding protein